METALTFKPQLLTEVPLDEVERYLNDTEWCFEQKLDGIFLSFRSQKDSTRNSTNHNHGMASISEFKNRSGSRSLSQIPNDLYKEMRYFNTIDIALDGELLGGIYYLYDLPYLEEVITKDSTFTERRTVLTEIFKLWNPGPRVQLIHQAVSFDEKAQLLSAAIANNYEGIVAKRSKGRYSFGRRSKDILKFKFVKEVDTVIADKGVGGKDNYVLSLIDNGKLVEVCHCSAIGKLDMPIGTVVTVKYLYASEDRRLVQPRIVRYRDDKPAAECTIDQLQFTNKSVYSHVHIRD